MAGEDQQPMTDYEKERLSRIRENEACLQALGIRRLAASPLLHHPSSSAATGDKRKQKKRSDDADEEYLPSDDGGREEEQEESSSASDQDDEEEIKHSSRSRQKGKKKMLSNSGKSPKSTSREESAPITDFVDDDTALQQDLQKIPWQQLVQKLQAQEAKEVKALLTKIITPYAFRTQLKTRR